MAVRCLIYYLLLISLACCSSAPTRRVIVPPADLGRVSVMTYNVNFAIAGDPATLRVISTEDADVVFLQEVNDAWAASLREHLDPMYPHAAFKADDEYAAGLGVMSKWPIESIEYLPKVSWFPAARVVLVTPIGRLQVLNLHLRPPVSAGKSFVKGYFVTPAIREAEVQAFVPQLDPDLPTLIVGDFNENEFGRAGQWLDRQGYKSALPEFDPEAETWRWPFAVNVLERRYDHLCYDKRLVPLNVNVRKAGWSDHLPVVGTFVLADEMKK